MGKCVEVKHSRFITYRLVTGRVMVHREVVNMSTIHDKQRSSQRKCVEHLSNLPSHPDNVTHQGISISQPCYGDKCMESLT